jgi:hypothetical protein
MAAALIRDSRKESGTAKTTKTSKKKYPEDFIFAVYEVFAVKKSWHIRALSR